jgi:ubiquinone/menaquinone biosynthesis C-methylase UbiE
MDQDRLSFLAHATHRFLSPVSVETLDRMIAVADPKPGALCFDLGCGFAAMALHLAERWGLQVKAVDRSPLMIGEAKTRLAGRGAPGSVALIQGDSTEVLAREGDADLVVAIWATAPTETPPDAATALAALARHVRPGGSLLWGETHWKREPSEMMGLLLGQAASAYGSHSDYVHAGETAGLLPLYAVTASGQEWDEYTWRYTTALETHLRDHPDDPDAPILHNRAQGWRSLYLTEGRETMGFGLYLFRKM